MGPRFLSFPTFCHSASSSPRWVGQRGGGIWSCLCVCVCVCVCRWCICVGSMQLYVDTVGPPAKYEAKLKAVFPSISLINVREKADSLFLSVGGASILAKVTRDKKIHECAAAAANDSASEGRDAPRLTEAAPPMGSGYPSDPTTVKFLDSVFDPVFGFPRFVRMSWSTATKRIEDKGVKVDWYEEEEEEKGEKGDNKKRKREDTNQKKLTSYSKNTVCIRGSNLNATKNMGDMLRVRHVTSAGPWLLAN
eukprot:GHVU01081590.1.p1 GENE.GHVU01081590.1~~GHVU01081590.1.p1  ORF type:complete len:250 (+),score=30.05 GHVU01081590.1:737-1486(+)